MSKTLCRHLIAGLLCSMATARGEDSTAKFLGANSCASTGCHGGGGAKQNQFLIWSLKDFHSQRPAATLTTARSKQIADALDIKDPTADARCTTCHAPLREVPENLRGENFKVSEGVSCESCHGPSENWLRAHTRHDYTRADRTAAGMRDLQDLYVRANTCVACHQVVSAPLLKAGHPELIFELDGQSLAEPKHWSAEKNGNRAQAWFVGEAVALREMSWELAHADAAMENEVNRWRGLYWLVARAAKADAKMTAAPDAPQNPGTQDFQTVQKWADDTAQAASQSWPDGAAANLLALLAKSSDRFASEMSTPIGARCAERLVLALDRLAGEQNNHKADAELDQLFKLAQCVPDFDPKQFAAALDKFSVALATP